MALTKVCVIYSRDQLVRRELIVCGDDADYDVHWRRMQSGEGWLNIPIEVYNNCSMETGRWGWDSIDTYIAAILGNPKSDICAIVNGEEIVAVCAADPRIDQHPEGWIIQDDRALTGLVYDFENATVVLPVEEVIE